MLERYCVRQLASITRQKWIGNRTFSTRLIVYVLFLLTRSECIVGEMTSGEDSPGQRSTTTEFSVQSYEIRFADDFEQTNRTISEATSTPEPDVQHGTYGNLSSTSMEMDSVASGPSEFDSIENSLIPESETNKSLFTPSPISNLHTVSGESMEVEDEDKGDEDELVNEKESEYDLAQTSAKTLLPLLQPAYEESETSANSLLTLLKGYHHENPGVTSIVTPTPRASYTVEPKSMLTSNPVPLISASSFTTWMPSSTTPRAVKSKHSHLKKAPPKLVTSPSSTKRPSAKHRPKKVVTFLTTKKAKAVTATPKPFIPMREHAADVNKDPHHPHGVVVFDKRKKRPKPSRNKPKPVLTDTLTTYRTTTTTTTSTTPSPVADTSDYYDYLNSGESSEEVPPGNSTKRVPGKVPLSKLAMAMIASSTVFENGTSSEDAQYPKLPVNLLNILQSYTKQVQMTTEGSAVQPTVVQIQSTPFMVHLNKLPFATRIAISVYYSLIAIIPLIYLAFGGLGRIGLMNAFSGRGLGFQPRMKRSLQSTLENLRTTFSQRADLNEDDESIWILKRIADIMQEFSPVSNSERRLSNAPYKHRN